MRRLRPRAPLDLRSTLACLQRGGGDPTGRPTATGGWWRALRTPDGAATLHLERQGADVVAESWGAGAAWLLDRLPDLVGERDDPTSLVPVHGPVAQAARLHPGFRVIRTGLVVEALVPAIIEQKVTGHEAFGGYRRLVRTYGEPAPGPGAALGLVVAPPVAVWRQVPSWAWLRAGVDGARSATIQRALAVAPRLEECAGLELREAHRRLRTVPGIGVWTAAEVRQRALGDADAVSFGDYHVARNVTWALTGVEGDDHAMARVLEPYAGHRYRVARLLELSGAVRPRRGPRMAPRTHLPR
ncbi:DNA-3-methyladenine glycosylase family protein [Arsenicicoccus sp. oral taxon 190]|uniref:DNA-3-methyladenine glycosylase family protein n=1 Tax=Arsenicicoccus sp. oral taxon 190 TaxID=1658671 RepID=UPI00067A0BDE|nr:3-methyladenine DNA glycosylase [Arsenicicoccus sp. oral taxon 190]AKT52385.1 3-methyladenine DNA glycosylase [Arsenicicoccus sp. oral taxon 190]